jgi:low temperature requirement protein LtrA
MSTQTRPSTWLRPPELRITSDPEERHATWLELFFDLVLVAAVGQLATALSHDLSAGGFARYFGVFIPVAWAWVGYTFYANRFDTDDLVYRIVTSAAMLAVAALAVNVGPTIEHGHSSGFAVAFICVRVPLILLYARAWRYATGAGRQIAGIYGAGFSAGTLCWALSLAFHGPARYALWALGLAIDFTMPPLGWRVLGAVPLHAAHITERYGLFVIIVLGEAVLAVVAGTSGLAFDFTTSMVAVASFLAALSLWWIYFDFADTSVLGRGMMGLVFMYTHFPLFAGVAAFGAGVKVAIHHSHAAHLDAGARWAVCAGIAAYLLSLALLHLAAEWTTLRDRAFIGRVVCSSLALLLAGFGGGLRPLAFMLLVAAGAVAQLVLEAVTYPTGAASVWVPPPASSSA